VQVSRLRACWARIRTARASSRRSGASATSSCPTGASAR
jgi:hypothetical protein